MDHNQYATKREFRAALRRNGITCDQFAALIGRALSTVYDYGGRYPVPYYARVLVFLIDERGGSHGLLGAKASPGVNQSAVPPSAT